MTAKVGKVSSVRQKAGTAQKNWRLDERILGDLEAYCGETLANERAVVEAAVSWFLASNSGERKRIIAHYQKAISAPSPG